MYWLLIVWYTNWENRGYLSRTAIKTMPREIMEDRWKDLSQQLNSYRNQEYRLKIRKKT